LFFIPSCLTRNFWKTTVCPASSFSISFFACELTLQIKGMASDPHSEVPFITMVNGRGETLLDAEASTVKSYAQAKSYKQMVPLFGPFNPCEKIAQN
jgi:hypothetical protein